MVNNTLKRFDSFDWEWLIISFGMALGAGIVLVPVTVSVVGISIYIISALVAYPAIYLFQKLYMNTLFETTEAKCYSEVIKELLGTRWSIVLGLIYFIMMLIWTIVYAEAVFSAFSDYLFYYNILNTPLNNNMFYSLILMIILVIVGTKSHKLLFKVTTLLTLILLLTLITVSIYIVPQWNLSQIYIHPKGWGFIPTTIIMFPFSLTTILFIQSLSPMFVAYRIKYPKNNELARYKSQRTMKVAFIILLSVVSFYVLSFSLITPQHQAIIAKDHGYSIFHIMLHLYKNDLVLNICGTIISICAVLAAFMSILNGMRESLLGLLLNISMKLNVNNLVSPRQIDFLIIVIIILVTWLSIVFQVPIFYLIPLCGPIFGIVGCLVPAYLVFNFDQFNKYRGFSVYYVVFVGVILCISPLLTTYLG